MVNKVRTLDFLPEVFRTATNSQFLNATLDVLVQQPNFNRVEGFIGGKYGYAVEPTDRYVIEPTKVREDYQLDPAVVFLKQDTQTAQDFITYPGILDALKNQGAVVNNNERLFENQFYSWDSFIDLDKIVNYSQYYWIPNGPNPVTVSTDTVYLNQSYTVNKAAREYEFENLIGTNPSLTLIRGGTYLFTVNQTSGFWIQGEPGVTGQGLQPNINTRDVLGVTNNGDNRGTISFTVPAKTAQQQYDFPGNDTVDLLSTAEFEAINGQNIATVTNIDGVTQLNNKTVMFYNNGELPSQVYYYTISVNPGTGIITLIQSDGIINNQKITVTSGSEWVGRSFYRDDTGTIQIIPYISSILDRLYYQDGTDPLAFGIINIVDSNESNTIDINEILGRKTYTSPNGVTFINGLKIIFEGNVTPSVYQNQEYYVTGVGTSIDLLSVNEYLAVEVEGEGIYHPWSIEPWDISVWDQSVNVPINPEYITIDRNSRDRNAWSRANRWFNAQVINATTLYNGRATTEESNQPVRALRPIIEFYGNLGLFNTGTKFLTFVDLFDNVTTDAFDQVVGQTEYTIDGQSLEEGQTVIFNADINQTVRQAVYQVRFVQLQQNAQPVITLTPAVRQNGSLDIITQGDVITVGNEDQIYVISGDQYRGTAWQFRSDFEAGSWRLAQQKTGLNQPPLFDIVDDNEISLSNPVYYPGTVFAGTKLFSYTPGTGGNDPVLGFPISYSSAVSIGDIQFTVNLNSDTFTYYRDQQLTEKNINIGFVNYYLTREAPAKRTGWVVAADPSVQYQVFEFAVTADGQQSFICDVPARITSDWRTVQVYYNDVILDTTFYSYTIDTVTGQTTVTVDTATIAGDKITILVLSDKVSATAYYQIPSNLQNNPFNENITTVDVGDLKNQYRTIFSNAPGITGQIFGPNNIYNLENLNRYGTAIIQNSASLVLPGVFLRKPGLNLFEALQYNSDQYTNYKTLLVDLTNSNDFNIYTTPAQMLDTVIYEISTTKNSTGSFFWSDMLFSGSAYRTNDYKITELLTDLTLPLGRVYDFTSANYYGLGIYLTRTVSGATSVTQLIKNVDYTVSEFSPTVTITYDLLPGDTVSIKEYNQTYGTYCPNTPTKLGLYPASIPGVILDNTYTTPTYFILGHDGSYNRLYGDLVNGQLTDFRDKVLLEFETRIYNNLKVSGIIPLTEDEVIPGAFRQTDYTRTEILDIYRSNFLNWVGLNRVDYKTQVYNTANQFTYNYTDTTNIVDGDLIQQGYWRGIYDWFYDTSNPAAAPWEMLGLVNRPDWWTARYGAAPYTSDNTYMWSEISRGFVWNNGDSYINPERIRPDLLQILPVDTQGNLVSPLNNVVANYNSLTFKRNWVVGDQAPTETTYLRSSSWPFDLMRLLALTKPAKFFNLFADRDLYRYSAEFDQYLYNGRYHLDPTVLEIYGNGVSKNSYINWVVDYINQRGVNGTDEVTNTLRNLDVRLVYRVAGFSDKNYLKFLIEKSTPNTQNTSLLIPDDSYKILLYDNVPEDRIVYSSVIVQKTSEGYTVWGNSQSKPTFTVSVPKPGVRETLRVGTVSVEISRDYFENRTATVPYGTLFYSLQGVSEFLGSYGNYLKTQGMIFGYVDDSVTYDWNQIILEYINWGQQQWAVGSTISLNPAAKLAEINREGLVVQPLTIQQQNFVLNQNLVPIQSQNACIDRDQESFTIKVLSQGDTVAYTNLNLSSMEHAVVFDNYTIFNDTIYNLTTGLRQTRLLLRGWKTGEWRGYVDAQGFILNEDNVKDWEPNVKYAKGKIVTYKDKYWTAARLIEPQAEFDKEVWVETDYDQIKVGLLPNPSTNAYESLYYYDSYRANFENDTDLLSFSLIGYRPRQYLADADLSDITQINVYKNIIKEKGTNLIANAFKQANLIQGQIDYDVKENWAIKSADFGSVLGSNFVECILSQSLLTGNPTTVGFSTGTPVLGVQQTVAISEIINYERPPLTANFLPQSQSSYTEERGLPTAGYVNTNDVKYTTYNLLDLSDDVTNIDTLYRGDNIWVANYRGTWQVFGVESMNNQVRQVINNLDGTITVSFSRPHGLVINDPFAIVGFDARVNGFYEVLEVASINSVIIPAALSTTDLKLTGVGTSFKLVSRRFNQASDQVNSTIPGSEFYSRKSWVDENSSGDWAVWEAGPIYTEQQVPPPSFNQINKLGASVGYSTNVGYITGNPQLGLLYHFYNDVATGQVFTETIQQPDSTLGTDVVVFDDSVYASDTLGGRVFVYTSPSSRGALVQNQIINQANTGAIAVSRDRQWLYIANSVTRTIYVYALNFNQQYQYVTEIVGPSTATGFGKSIATSIDGVKLIVGSPEEDILSESSIAFSNAGATYVYTRSVERIVAVGTFASTYSVSYPIPNAIADVYVDDVLTTAVTINPAGFIEFGSAPTLGSTITVSYGHFTLSQKMYSANPITGAGFGTSVSTNKYGAQILIGSPGEIATVQGKADVQGAVYCWTNSGQQYGIVTTELPGSAAGVIFIDGYRVQISGTAAQVAQQINEQTPTNTVARANNNILQISVISNTVEVANNIIDITGEPSVLASLGLTLYTTTQRITSPTLAKEGLFGSKIAMSQRNSIAISAPQATQYDETTFDYTDDAIIQRSWDITRWDESLWSQLTIDQSAACEPRVLENYTLFDQGTTTFIDQFENTGVVYEYDLLPSSNESIVNPGQYVFGQYIQINSTVETGLEPEFGTGLAFNDSVIVVGAPNWYLNGNGLATGFVSLCKPSSWYVDKQPLARVDINKLNNISIYDTITNQTIEYLDYIDPVQGKLLGAVETNLDYISSNDPAMYRVGQEWTAAYVGKMWLDTTNLRMLNYNQPDYTYDISNWGVAFSGSTADVYTWIVSSVPPVQYPGPGFVVNFDNYNVVERVDRSTDSIVTDYYFWVRNLDAIPPGKTLSPLSVSQYILDPQTSGIAYLIPVTTNVVGLVNCESAISSGLGALHIGYNSGNTQDQKHQQWNLIKQNDADDFLPGFPSTVESQPTGLYLKYIDSFAGQNQQGMYLPVSRLPELLKYGTGYPQSMFRDRALALENYIEYANDVLIQFPIAESRDLYFLNKVGIARINQTEEFNWDMTGWDQFSWSPDIVSSSAVAEEFITYDTRRYWRLVDWWAPGYSSDTKIILEVDQVSDLQKLQPNQTNSFTERFGIVLIDGLVVRVRANSSGNSEVWTYFEATGWTRVGLQFGTVEILPSIYEQATGWDSDSWAESTWESSLAPETYWIIRWLNEQAYTNDLLIERNNSLILMFNYCQTEALQQQNYMPWLNKTSLIDVSHKVSDLFPYKKFQRDNQEFLAGYLNEIKPFHVRIKDFSFVYDGLDPYPGNITDFDLPAQYVQSQGQFQSPQLTYGQPQTDDEYSPDSPIWSQPEYSEWFNNYGLSIDQDNTLSSVTTLRSYITSQSTEIPVKNAYGLPDSGYIFIQQEQISYDRIDRVNNVLTGVVRGVLSTASEHYAGTAINTILPSVIVLDQARGYQEPPEITAVIDTSIFPVPRAPAVLSAVMSGDRLLSVTVVNGGSGYAVTPTLTVEGSTILATFGSSALSTVFNTITIPGHTFETGDPVVYSVGTDTVEPIGLTPGDYYYVRVIDQTTIALYRSLRAAVNYDKRELIDDGRVKLITTGSGSNNSLTVTARVAAFMTSSPVRENITTIKFDRTSYQSSVTTWVSGGIYAGEFSDIGKLSSSTLLADSTSPWEYLGWDSEVYDQEILASAQGAVFPVQSIVNPGYVSDVIILDINYGQTTVSPGQLNGQRVTMYRRTYNQNGPWSATGWGSNGWSKRDPGYTISPWSDSPWSILAWDQYTQTVKAWVDPRDYWVKVTSENTVQLYYDRRFTQPVNPLDFDYTAADVMFLAEPFTFDRSLVTYAGSLYRCVICNNDVEFDYTKWELVESGSNTINAADRVTAYYTPTVNMSGRDIRQLMTGIEYPDATFLGAPFDYDSIRWDTPKWDIETWSGTKETFQYDTDLISPSFTYDPETNPTIYDVQGGQFAQGYGPEELVPGVVTDELDFGVTTAGVDLSFRITVNKAGFGTVYNTNPYTQTILTRDFISTDSIADVLHVEDASRLVVVQSTTVMVTSGGRVLLPGNVATLTSVTLSVPNGFTVNQIGISSIELIIDGITSPTSVTVTYCLGNMLLINSEYIQFTNIDLVNNTVTGLLRGRKGTITNHEISSGTIVQSVLSRDRLPANDWNTWWYNTTGWNVGAWNIDGWNNDYNNGTLDQSTTESAEFLKRTSP